MTDMLKWHQLMDCFFYFIPHQSVICVVRLEGSAIESYERHYLIRYLINGLIFTEQSHRSQTCDVLAVVKGRVINTATM